MAHYPTSPQPKHHLAMLSRSYLATTGVPRASNPNHIDVKIIGDGFGFLLWLDELHM